MTTVNGDRSTTRFVAHVSEIKSWILDPPSVEEARPPACPCCRSPSCPLVGGLTLHGHGLRERQVRGPEHPWGKPLIRSVLTRRYLCVACGAMIVVGPRGLAPRRLFSTTAVAFAMALFGLCGQSAFAVRRQVSPWSVVGATAASGWGSLKRWARAIRDGQLFGELRRCPAGWSLRQVAARAAAALAARSQNADRSLALAHHAWLGAAQSGRAIVM